jgi:acyl-CoA synthetase (AMP-forming)/AMP-acid ligase II
MAPLFSNLSDAIFYWARERPDAPAIRERDAVISYGALAPLIGRAAVHLRDLGVKPGELVGLSLPPNAPHLILLFALLRIGAIPVDAPLRGPAPLDTHKLFGVNRMIAPPGVEIPAGVTAHRLDGAWKDAIAGKSGDFRHPGPPDYQLIFSLSSGSTGAPKGVVTTMREWNERFRSAAALLPEFIDPARPPTLLALGEFSFSGFFFFIANQFCVGGPIVLLGLTPTVDALIEEINKHDDTVFLVTPPMVREFLAKAREGELLLPKTRAFVVGGATLHAQEKTRVRERVSKALIEVYGNAATGFITALRAPELERHGDSVGRVAPGLAVDIVDERGRIAPPGAIGVVRCRGSGVSQRFVVPRGTAPSDAEGLREGSYYPGDVGLIDINGYLHLRGRVAETIRRGGVSLYPAEIEGVLLASPLVAEAAVFGVPLGGGEPSVAAVLVARGEPDLAAVAQHCRERLPAEKLPNHLFYADALPRVGPGKVDTAALRAQIAEKLKQAPNPAPAP